MRKSIESERSSLEMVEEIEPKFDALLVLGAVMEWNDKRSRWEFPSIIQHYAGKLVIGKARALATREVQDEAPIILVTGGSDKNPRTGEIESRSVELSKLMTERYKIPKEKITSMGKIGASHTAGNIENLIQYLEDHPEVLKTKRIGILSPRFQKERVALMFEENPYFKDCGIKLEWLIVEDILEDRDPRYKKWADALYATPEAEINRQMEQKGIENLHSGKYKPRT